MTALNEEDEQQTLESMLGGTCNKKQCNSGRLTKVLSYRSEERCHEEFQTKLYPG